MSGEFEAQFLSRIGEALASKTPEDMFARIDDDDIIHLWAVAMKHRLKRAIVNRGLSLDRAETVYELIDRVYRARRNSRNHFVDPCMKALDEVKLLLSEFIYHNGGAKTAPEERSPAE